MRHNSATSSSRLYSLSQAPDNEYYLEHNVIPSSASGDDRRSQIAVPESIEILPDNEATLYSDVKNEA
jgi:hypothetical protein